MGKNMRIWSAIALLVIALLVGCAETSRTDEVQEPDVSASPQPTPVVETAAPSINPVSLEEWLETLPIQTPAYTFSSSDLDIEEGINWPTDGVTLNLGEWHGTAQEAADLAGITFEELKELNPEVDFSGEDNYYYELRIQEEPYFPPQVPVREVTIEMPWLASRYLQNFTCKVPAELDEQAATVMASAYYFLREHYGVHIGMEPSTYNQEKNYYTTTDGALCTSYTQLEEYLSCIFTPECYESMLGGPMPDDGMNLGLYYKGADDSINFIMSDRGGSLAHCGTLFTQPETLSDGSIQFWQLSLRLDIFEYEGFAEGQTYTPVAVNASRVRLVPTEAGWRVAELQLPY